MGYFIGFRIDPEPFLPLLAGLGEAVKPENLHVTVLHLGNIRRMGQDALDGAHRWTRAASSLHASFEATIGPMAHLWHVTVMGVSHRDNFQRILDNIPDHTDRIIHPHMTVSGVMVPLARELPFSIKHRFDRLCVFESTQGDIHEEASYPMLPMEIQGTLF